MDASVGSHHEARILLTDEYVSGHNLRAAPHPVSKSTDDHVEPIRRVLGPSHEDRTGDAMRAHGGRAVPICRPFGVQYDAAGGRRAEGQPYPRPRIRVVTDRRNPMQTWKRRIPTRG